MRSFNAKSALMDLPFPIQRDLVLGILNVRLLDTQHLFHRQYGYAQMNDLYLVDTYTFANLKNRSSFFTTY